MKDESTRILTRGADQVRWNLADLCSSEDDLDGLLCEADGLADKFADSYKGRVSSLGPADMVEALREMEVPFDKIGRARTYAFLNWSTSTNDPKRGALLQKTHESFTRIHQKLLFFELEWIATDDEAAERAMSDPEMLPFLHYLRVQRMFRPHVLSEDEEKILSEKSVTGRSAWSRFFDETIGATRFEFQNQEISEQELLAKLYDADRDVRRDAAVAFTDGLNASLRSTTFVFNTILADKASNDRLRRYPTWLSSRNMANQVTDEAAQNLIGAVRGRFDLVARFFRLKKRILGLDRMQDYDRYAPIGHSNSEYTWNSAKDIVLGAYGDFSPRMAEIASKFFDREWIDAPAVAGKRSGAFSHGAVPSAHPYVMVNYTGTTRDVQTLAHELGHGVHQYLARKQGVLMSDTPLTTAETASVFGEMLVFESLLQKEVDPRGRLAMLVAKIDDSIATVFRQIAMNLFEERIHSARRNGGELSSEAFGEHWIETQNEMFQESVTLGDHYKIWWSYIPHFVHTPGYVYAYAFGELLVLALFARYREEGSRFASKYLEMLEAGGSDWPHVLAARLGVDLNGSGFWIQGLAAVEHMIEQAEALAEKSDRQLPANPIS